MKIRITDLLDTYYDDSVKLDAPHSMEASEQITPIKSERKKGFSMHKPMLIAASLMLVLCGAAVLGLGLSREPAGTALSDGDAMISLSEEVPESIPAEPEGLYAADSPLEEASSAVEKTEDEVITQEEHLIYTAILDIHIEAEDGLLTEYGDYITKLKIDPSEGVFVWYSHLPALEALHWELSPEGTYSDSLRIAEFQQEDTAWYNFLMERYFATAVLTLSDGTVLTMGSGEAVGYLDGQFWQEGPLSALEEENGVTIGDAVPVEVTIDGVSYAFEVSTEVIEPPPEIKTADQTEMFSEYEMVVDKLTLYPTEEGEENATTCFSTEQMISFSLQSVCAETNTDKTVDMTYRIYDTEGNEVAFHTSTRTWSGSWTTIVTAVDVPVSMNIPGEYTLEILFNDQFFASEVFTVVEPADPLVIPQSVPVEDLNGDGNLAAEDLNGDGILSAQLDLSVMVEDSEATLVRFTYDLTSGKFTWYMHSPLLMAQLYEISPSGDMSDGLIDESWSKNYATWSNTMLENYYTNASLIMTDGTEILLGGGSVVDFVDDLFIEWHQYEFDVLNDYYGTNLKTEEIAYLLINGVTYQFE